MSRRLGLSALAILLVTVAGCGGSSSPTSPTTTATSTTTTTTTTTGGGTTSTPAVAYVQDVKAVLDADCIRCHNASTADGGVNLSTYAAVMRTVTAGSASSALVRTTQSGGSMYRYWSGTAATKAELVRSWVVSNGAAETR